MNPSSSPPPAGSTDLASRLSNDEYMRRRTKPRWRDIECLILIDLRETILLLCQNLSGRTLDYGCGGSPYKEFLPQFSPYVRADIAAAEGIDLVFDSRGSLPNEPDGSYDVILSTQVLEHVPDPERYLAEAYRLVRPGGSLVLTTHGFIPEHGCPHDYYRWTGYGLERAAQNAGFIVEEGYKLTVGLRAAIYLFHFSILYTLGWRPGTVVNWFFGMVRKVYHHFGISTLNRLGYLTKQMTRVSSHADAHSLYIGVALRARKPGSSAGAA